MSQSRVFSLDDNNWGKPKNAQILSVLPIKSTAFQQTKMFKGSESEKQDV